VNGKHISLVLLSFASLTGRSLGQQGPSYAKQVRPFLAAYCVECHNAKTFKAGLDLETYKALLEGSDRGPVLVKGKPDESLLVLLPEKKKQPHMPPRKAKRFPKPAETAILRAWIAAGAKDDSVGLKVNIPDIKPHRPMAASVPALAYRPDGKQLAVARYRTVAFVDPTTGQEQGKRLDVPGTVTALAYSRDGARLAAAVGKPGMPGSVLLFDVPPAGQPWPTPRALEPAHKDVILDMTFSPDGALLATGSYDTTIKLWDTRIGKEIRTLREHSDSVYGVAFHPDGKVLASGAADRAVKVWEVQTGKLLYTLGEATDWVYAVAWSPDGKHLAAAGVDRSIRVWETGADKGKLAHSVFAHEAPIIRLVYAGDGKTLFSLGEDRIVKAWDPERMLERRVYARQPEAPLALAVRPDGKQLALGRYDGGVVFLDVATGKATTIGAEAASSQKASDIKPPAAKVETPQANQVMPAWGTRGRNLRLTFTGKNLSQVTELSANHAGVKTKVIPESRQPTSLQAEIAFPATIPAGVYQLTLHSPAGKSASLSFPVDLFETIEEKEPNNSPGRSQKVTLPVSVAGVLGKAGDVDFYSFDVREGEQVGVQILSTAGTKLEPLLQLTDRGGTVLSQSSTGLLGYTFSKAGTYALGVRDRELRGGPGMTYRLHIGPIPLVTSVFPLGMQRGSSGDVRVQGVFLGGAGKIPMKIPADGAVDSRLPVPLTTSAGPPLGIRNIVVGEFPEVLAAETRPGKSGPLGDIPVPGTANGIIRKEGQSDVWRFRARKGERLIVEVNAQRLGSDLDSTIEILDELGRPVARATLRALAKTYVTFRDHDSASTGIRIEAWDELAVNDYIYVGSELLRIQALPPNPDADCNFFSVRGQRIGYLDTTPTHHSMGTPMYKVEIHPPGTKFPANGYPAVTLYYRNDDGGPGFGRDSRLFFEPAADGVYQVRIGDARGQGGENYAYRLTVRTPRPSFNVSFSPTQPTVARGSGVPITATADRLDAYAGPIDVRLENLPAGFSAPATTIPAGENSTVFTLFAEAGAKPPAKGPVLKLMASARIQGKEIVKEALGGLPRLVDAGDIVTTTERAEVSVKPGGQATLTVTIDRRNGFQGRVPLDVRGLPHGVRVLDIGLNGILITEKESRRTIVIYAEPWVEATTHPFVVLARRESTGAEYAARSVLLKIAKPPR
jgi:WD40 repeat protein